MLPAAAAALGAVAVAGPVPVLVGAGVAVQSSFNPQRAYRAILKLDSKNARVNMVFAPEYWNLEFQPPYVYPCI